MAQNAVLGGREYLVLAAVPRLRDTDLDVSLASGVAVQKEIERQTGRLISIGSVCTTLDRLEKKKLLTSDVSDRDGRRPKRFYSLSEPGHKTLVEAKRASDAMWKGLDRMLPKLAPAGR
jgi:DNA-binding PadR family transcriptional regulator